MTEGDGLVLAHMVDLLTNRVDELTEEVVAKDRAIILLRQANMAQSVELQRLRSKENVLP